MFQLLFSVSPKTAFHKLKHFVQILEAVKTCTCTQIFVSRRIQLTHKQTRKTFAMPAAENRLVYCFSLRVVLLLLFFSGGEGMGGETG